MPLTISLDYDHTDEITDAMERGVEQAVQDGASDIAGTAQAIVPVKRGFLRRSITMKPEPSINGWVVYSADIPLPEGGVVDYEKHVEYGTKNMAAQPYLRPAYERHQSGIIAACEAAIRRHATGR